MSQTFHFPTDRRIDIACLGRLAVDLYAQQFGSRLEDARSMAMYLGGSSANLAFGVARLGLKSAMISRVGNEQMGRFLTESLQQEGCDTSQLQVDPERLTALVLLGLKDKDTFPLLFVRENCADMAVDASLIDESFIASCRSLAITGTHLSPPVTRKASMTALAYAKRHQLIRVLDIDYRPVLWGLTSRGAGEYRNVADAHVTKQLQEVLPEFDLLVGTEEEFFIAGGVADDVIASLRAVRALSKATLVVKRGSLGCCVIEGDITADINDAPTYKGENVEVLNVLGAGDAFLSGLMASLLQGKTWAESTQVANACGAMVVSRHACSAAMPTPAELTHWLGGSRNPKVDADQQLAHLHRVTAARPDWSELCVMAFDHRSQFFDMVREARETQEVGATEASESRIPALKKLLVKAAEQVERSHQMQGHTGVLIDGGAYGADALASATGRGWWVGRPVELPGSRPLRFDGTRSIGSALIHWPTEQVVKCLVHYHPDDAFELRLEQEQKVLELWEATRESGNELLLEIICPSAMTPAGTQDAAVLRSVKRFYNLGVKPEWWKLAPMQTQGWTELANLVAERDPYCRGAVILGLNQPLQVLADSFASSTNPIVKGFMVGRTLWATASLAWLKNEINDDAFVKQVAHNFATLVDAWRQRHAHV
jgi:5-dehydro-2-deoxygluconokinase